MSQIRVFILHDRPAGVWLLLINKVNRFSVSDSFVMLPQKQCIELESKHILRLFFISLPNFAWLFPQMIIKNADPLPPPPPAHRHSSSLRVPNVHATLPSLSLTLLTGV